MEIQFIGACHEVTGSKHLLKVADKYLLIDYGMKQGIDYYEDVELPIKPSQIDFIIITHAHIDHTGLLPKLYKDGFRGRVLCTTATQYLLEIMLKDSAHIQEQDAREKNKSAKRRGQKAIQAEYTVSDVEALLDYIDGYKYDETIELSYNVKIIFRDAGHIIGSSLVEVYCEEGSDKRKLVFSGDLGNDNKPIIKDPTCIEDADYVLLESTYGNRLHPEEVDHEVELAEIIQRTLDRGGNVVIPSFAVGRTQELLYIIRAIKEKNLVKNHDGFRVVVDSPMAVSATQVYFNIDNDYFDEETMALINQGINPIAFPNLELSISVEDSMALNDDMEPKVILSASGMADAGRVRHHIKYNVWREESTIVFAGYQAEGTLGRILLDGVPEVKLFGEKFAVKAEIVQMSDMSSHADKNGLLKWVSHFTNKPKRIFLVHGQDEAMTELQQCIKEQFDINTECPFSGSIFDLTRHQWRKEAEAIPVEKGYIDNTGRGQDSMRKNNDYEKLLSSTYKLLDLVKTSSEWANKDLKKMKDEVDTLLGRWK